MAGRFRKKFDGAFVAYSRVAHSCDGMGWSPG